MHVAFCCDDNYIMPASIMLESLLVSNKGIRIIAHTFSDGLNSSSVSKLEVLINKYNGKLELHKLPEQALEIMKKAPLAWEYLSVTTYYRLLLPYVVEMTVDKVIYLDCDVMVRGNLYKYYFEQKANSTISGSRDIEETQHSVRLGLKQYINAGILVMNLEKIRSRFNMEQMLNEMNRLMSETYLKCGDQDIINILFEDGIEILPDAFNYQYVIHKMYILKHRWELSSVDVVHFITNDKPWNNTYCFPFAKEYYIWLKRYLSVREKILWWLTKPFWLVLVLIKHMNWKKEQKGK